MIAEFSNLPGLLELDLPIPLELPIESMSRSSDTLDPASPSTWLL